MLPTRNQTSLGLFYRFQLSTMATSPNTAGFGGNSGTESNCGTSDLIEVTKGDRVCALSESVSQRALETLESPAEHEIYARKARLNAYDPKNNPDGIVDFGIAENKLCEDLVVEKLKAIQLQGEDTKFLYYGFFTGMPSCKKAIKELIEQHFHPLEKLDVNNILIQNGVTPVLDFFAFALADKGDYFMVPSPHYYRTENDLFDRAGVKTVNVPFRYKEGGKPSSCHLDSTMLEEAYQTATKEGKKIRAILLFNPNNPSGEVFTKKQLADILQCAYRHNLHLVANEIYALSVFDPEVTFTSILSVPHPDPEMVHMTWGVSKDLSISGYRLAMFYSRNPKVIQYAAIISAFTMAVDLIEHRVTQMLSDHNWLTEQFLPTKYDRMNKRYHDMYTRLEQCGARVYKSGATMFVWADFSMFLPEKTFEEETQLFKKIYRKGVFVVQGQKFYHKEPGMFRIVYTAKQSHYEEGMKRLTELLQEIQMSKVKTSNQ